MFILPFIYIYYLDVNNLYGEAMSQYLPVNNFKWVEGDDFNKLCELKFIESIPDDSQIGYIFSVDLEY